MKPKRGKKKPTMKYQLNENRQEDRLRLNEGRTKGISFAFVKKDGDKIILTMPMSACKDYLNDKVYSEITGKDYTIYGMTTHQDGILNGDRAHLVMGVVGELGYHGGDWSRKSVKPYANMEADEKLLEGKIETVVKLVNYFEDKFKIKDRTSIEMISRTRFLVDAPIFWAKATYRISLLAHLLRVGYKWNGDMEPMDFLRAADTPDSGLANQFYPNLQKMMEGVIPEQNLNAVTMPHNLGMIGFKFP